MSNRVPAACKWQLSTLLALQWLHAPLDACEVACTTVTSCRQLAVIKKSLQLAVATATICIGKQHTFAECAAIG